MRAKRTIGKIIYHVLVCGFGLIMIYPLVWMVMSAFKPTNTIFTTAGQLIPETFTVENYINGWKGFAGISFGVFFRNSLFISIVATIGTVLVSSVVAYGLARCKFRGRRILFVAMLLNKKHKALGLYRTFYYIPSIIGGSIAVSIVWKQIFGNKGVIMSLLSLVGIEQQNSLLGNPKTALATIVLMGVWQFGSSMLIFLSALKQIPNSLYESAEVDGAKRSTIFFKITLPMLTPTIFFNLIMQIVNGFRVFTESYIITDGGPMDSTLSYVLYLYRRAFTYFDMGYSCALAWILVAIIAVFTIILFKTQNRWVYYETGED